jgi:hypothetical protein
MKKRQLDTIAMVVIAGATIVSTMILILTN